MPITAVRSTLLTTDADGDGVADSGDILTHTLIITNTDALLAALNIVDTETENGITIDAGSVLIGPIALNDAFDITGNTPFTFTAAQLLGNDLDPDDVTPNLTITGVSAGTNGTLVDNLNGTYTFTPNVGLDIGQTASFTYSIEDADGVDSVAATPGLVTFNITDVVWYVDSAYSGVNGASNGTYLRPFTSLTELNGVTGDGTTNDDVDAVNETIFIYDRGTSAYNAGITLENGQQLRGDEGSFTVNSLAIGATAANSTINHAGTGIVLGSGNTIHGFDLVGTATGAAGITDNGATAGTLLVTSTNITGQGQILDIDNGGTFNASSTLGTLTSTGSTGTNGGVIDLTGVTGTLAVTGATTINGTHSQAGIDISGNTGGLTVSFQGNVTVNNGANNAINVTSNTGTNAVTFSGGVKDVDTTSGTALNLTANTTTTTVSFTNGGLDVDTTTGTGLALGSTTLGVGTGANNNTITTTTGPIISAANATSSGISFATLTSGTTTGTAIDIDNLDGSTFNGGATTIAGSANDGINIRGDSSTNFTFGTTSINGVAGDGVELNGNSGSFTMTGGNIGSTNDPAGRGVFVTGGTGAVTVDASITKTTAGNVIDVTSHATGNVSFTGVISATGGVSNGINLVNNTSGSISFTNNVTLNTGAGTAFNFTNTAATGANVTLSGGNLNIDTTSGSGINVTNTAADADGGSLTISGANNSVVTNGGGRGIFVENILANLNMHDVSVSGGSNVGIYLRNTGATGSFVITGDASTANSGGILNFVAGGADGSTTQGVGIYLENARDVSLSNLNFNGTFSNFGIRGESVNNFTLRDSDVNATQFGTNSSVSQPEGAIRFGTPSVSTGLTGTALFEGNSIGTGSFSDGVGIYSYGSGSLNLTIRDNATSGDQAVFNPGANSGITVNDSVFIETGGTISLVATITNVDFTGARGDQLQITAAANTTQNLTITGNTFEQSFVNALGGGVRLGGGGNNDYHVTYNFSNNNIDGATVAAIDARYGGLNSDISGIIANNTVGTDNGALDTDTDGDGVLEAGEGSLANVGSIQGFGIWAGYDKSNGGTGEYALRIENNNIADVGAISGGGIVLSSNAGGGAGTARVEATLTNNVVGELGRNARSGLYTQIGGADTTDNGLMGLNISGNTFDASAATFGGNAITFDQVSSPSRYYFPGYVPGPTGANGEFNSFGPAGTASTVLDTFLDVTKANTLINGPFPFPAGVEVDATLVFGVTGNAFILPVPIMAAPAPGEDWEAAVRDWFANLPPPGSGDAPTPDTGDGGDPGNGDGGDPGNGGGGDPGNGGGDPPPTETPHPVIVDDGVLSQAELDYLAEAAIQRWILAGATPEQVAEMRATAISVGYMTGSYLGTSSADSIVIDSDGAGHGWFLDRTPGEDGEFGGIGSRLTADAGGPAEGRMDLLTVLMHEFGHQAGLDDLYSTADADELMYGYATLGERRLPQADDLVGADLAHSGHEAFTEILPTIPVLPAGKAVQILFESTVNDFANGLVPTGLTNFSSLAFSGVPGSPVTSNSNALVIDSLTLTGTIWNDNGAGGGTAANGTKDGTEAGVSGVLVSLFVDANNDDVADTPGTALATTTTSPSGDYSFANLADGTYIVRVDQDNFDAGGNTSLFTPGLQNSSPGNPDPDNNVDNDDNGSRAAGQAAFSLAITLDYNSETDDDGTGQLDINDTVDFGFFANSAPVLNDLAGDTSTFTEDGAAVILDDSSVPELAATVSDANQAQLNGATLTVAITVNEDAADDVLGISTAGTVTLSSGTNIGSIVSVGGLAIGTVTADGNGGDDLVVALNTNDATQANVSTLIQSLTYANADTANPSTLQRTIAVTINDGLGGSDSENVLVNVTAVNDAPSGTDNTISVDEDSFGDIDAADFGFTDPDSGDLLSEVIVTAVTGGILYYDSGNDGFDPGDAVLTFPITLTAADLAGNLVAFRAGPNVNGNGVGSITFQVVDDSGAGNDTDLSVNTLTVDVAPINDQPDVPATLADASATEQTPVTIVGITLSDVDLDALNGGNGDYAGANFVIGQAAPAATDSFSIDATGASFTINGSNLEVGGQVFATFDTSANILGIAFTSSGTAATTTLVNEVLARIQYTNTSDDPPATVSLIYGVNDGAPGGGQGTVTGTNNLDAGTVDVNITAVNDEPTLTATAVSPTFTEGDAARDLFSTVAASTVEAGQTFASMTLTVTNVTDGADEKLSIDGSIVTLTTGMVIGTANNGLTVNVSLVGTTATVSFASATLTEAQLNTLVDGLAYRNDSEDPTDADRVVTITELVDSGSNASPNDNTTALSIASTVNVEPDDDAPTTGNDTNIVDEDDTITGASVFTNDDDVDGPPLQVEAVNGVPGDVGTQITLPSGALLTLNSDGTYDYDPNDAFNYLISVATQAATGAVNISTTDSFTYDLVGGTGPATVTITINGVDSADDELWGDSGNNTINDTVDIDFFNLSQGGDDTANGQAGDDVFYFGAEFTPADTVDGGANGTALGDALVLLGDYDTVPLVLTATSLVNVETILVGPGFTYDITTNDGNVAAGATLTVYGGMLGALDELLFDGSAETDGRFILIGGGCDDTLIGGGRDDRLFGGADNNFLDGGAGNGDIVDYSLAAGAVDVDLSTGLANDNGYGGQDLLSNIENVVGTGFDDTLTGDSEINVLDGGAGADTMSGGGGSDGYIVDNVGDVAIENAGEGTDIVRSSVSFTLGANVENLDLTGLGNINATGNDDANTLTGNVGNNMLNGGLGADFLRGGFGDDTYVVDNVGDAINEFLGQGSDTVQSSLTYTLGYGLENLTLTGAGAIDGTGNIFANILIGNANSNTLDGKAGADAMNGGLGNDTYIVDNVGDTVTESSGVGGTDIVQSSATFTLGSNIENLTLTGANAVNGTGNNLVNTLIGNSAANILNGMGGADVMTGGLGNDTYVFDNVGDVANENAGEGTDTIQTSVTYTLATDFENLTLLGTGNVNGTGNGVNNVLTGNSGANTLNGLAGADTMIGNGGNDVYVVDNGLDQVIESAGGGTDTVNSSISYTLAAEIENLTLTGVAAINGAGNGLANTLTGNDANNTLNGGLGADTLKGGLGDDTYVVDNVADVVSDLAGQGTDTVLSSVTYTLGGATENLNLTGTDAINATGNVFANALNGNANANVLNGGGGADTMNAGLGNDTYIVDNAGDVVFETSIVGGTDEVQSSVNFTLSANIENLTLTGASAVNGTGNALSNILTGNGQANILSGLANDDQLHGAGGADSLHGGLGNDSLEGGAGNDGFYFENALIASNVDSVLDFTAVNDTFFLDDAVFTTLAAGTLAAGAFVNGNTALDADDRILYDSATGNIFYDADGSGGGSSAVLFATVTAGTAITNVDFIVF